MIYRVWPFFTGIAINKDGVIYVADGANIRRIDTDGIISTVIGSQDQPRSWKPISCDESTHADQVDKILTHSTRSFEKDPYAICKNPRPRSIRTSTGSDQNICQYIL